MISTTEQHRLADGITKLAKMLKALDGTTHELVLYGPSRHIVVSSPDGTIIAKAYLDPKRFGDEADNLKLFSEVNEARTDLQQKLGIEGQYIGLPRHSPRLDVSGIAEMPNGTAPIAIFAAVPGKLLYDTTRDGTANFEHYKAAAVQVARIQEEGKLLNRKGRLPLDDIVRDREPSTTDTHFFSRRRFKDIFLQNIIDYGNVHIPEQLKEEMITDWDYLVSRNLVKTHREGYTGYYFDGNPKHHTIDDSGKRVVSFDYEQRLYTPALLGIANLLSFGLGKGGKPYLSEIEQVKILDRVLLEIEFANALRGGLEDKAKRMYSYIKEREAAHCSDLTGSNSEEYFRFIGDNDVGNGKRRSEDFLSALPYAMLDRNAAWIGHKARYRSVAEFLNEIGLLAELGIRFEPIDPIRQNAQEQREHLQVILGVLEAFNKAPTRNGGHANDAAKRLMYRFGNLAQQPYFSQN